MLSTRAINSYRRSLKLWMGYVAEGHQASTFGVPAVTILGAMLNPDNGQMSDFLSRYRIKERDRRSREVRRVILLWLAELASD